jgi:type IV secretion system protein VirB9
MTFQSAYRTLSLAIGFAAGLMLAVPNSHSATVPPIGKIDARVRVLAYNPDDVILLRGYIGYQIHLQFARGEEFVNLGSGDNGAFDVGAERNHLFIKPKEARASTNLTVLTNRRTYHFDYVVSATAPTGAAAKRMVYSVRFLYPEEEARAAAANQQHQELAARLQGGTTGRASNADYWFCGSESLKPVSAHDDGMQTRLRFHAGSDFPALFVQNDDSSESLLNFHIEKDEVVIHRVARRFVLRRGKLAGCIVNQSFADRGTRRSTHTSASDVQRITVGDGP